MLCSRARVARAEDQGAQGEVGAKSAPCVSIRVAFAFSGSILCAYSPFPMYPAFIPRYIVIKTRALARSARLCLLYDPPLRASLRMANLV
ncbi:hypothetical protein IG631_23949 [Alternaria alternata]|nr:hypothetical protein IG631_23949 [Alternaria alternata]